MLEGYRAEATEQTIVETIGNTCHNQTFINFVEKNSINK